MDEKTIIEKLTRVSDAWKAQFQHPYEEGWEPVEGETLPDLPLVWSIQDGILFLDDVWITPVKFLRQDTLDEAPQWVSTAMELDLIDCSLDIVITKWRGKYSIAGIERALKGGMDHGR